MTRDQDIERVLESWFSDGPTRMPDRLFEGMRDRIEGVGQRHPAPLRRMSPRTSPMPSPTPTVGPRPSDPALDLGDPAATFEGATVADRVLTSGQLGTPLSLWLDRYGLDPPNPSGPARSDWCEATTSEGSIVLPWLHACLINLRFIRPTAPSECGTLSGGLMVGFLLSKGQPYWTLSCGLTGIIAASAGNDYYHPIQAMIVGGLGAVVAYKGHYFVERRFKIDDAVGAVAVHGYSGFFGVVIAGFLLWGYPAAAPLAGSAAPLFGVTPDGFPAVNPIGNIIGAVIMFGVLGFAPAYVVARIIKTAGLLRVPAQAELAGLDTNTLDSSYPYFGRTYTEFELIEKAEAAALFGPQSRSGGS